MSFKITNLIKENVFCVHKFNKVKIIQIKNPNLIGK